MRRLRLLTVFSAVLFTVLWMIFGAVNCNCPPKEKSDKPVYKGEYMGLTGPGPQPEVFAPGFISTDLPERDAAFTPDLKEFYFSVRLERFTAIVTTCQDGNGIWSQPEVAPFSGLYSDIEPCVAPGGKKFFFVSKRPLPGQKEASKFFNIWIMDRTETGWGAPYPIGAPVNGEWNVFYPSLTKDGTIYFNKRIGNGPEYIYRSRLKDGKYMEPEKLPENVNTTQAQFNAFIAPDESYLIIPVWGRKDSLGGSDYYVTFRDKNDTWSDLINLGDKINTPGSEYCPSVTPDGKYFFFHRDPGKFFNSNPETRLTYADIQKHFHSDGNGQGDIYWVDADVIRRLAN